MINIASLTQSQWTTAIITSSEYDLETWIQTFLTDRKAQNMSVGTIYFHKKKFKLFQIFSKQVGIKIISEITPTIIREYLLHLESKGHNPGGIHAAYRTLRASLNWFEAEVELEEWKNPIKKVRAPKVALEPLEPITKEHIQALLSTCDSKTFMGARDKAIILTLADSGVRAGELIGMDLSDIDPVSGSILIRHGKGNKSRTVYFGRTSRIAIRSYLHKRKSQNPALWNSRCGERITYSTLRCMIRRHSAEAKIPPPQLHAFHRFFGLELLRNHVDIFSIQKLLGHEDLQVMRRYLKQSDSDLQQAHRIGSLVDLIKKNYLYTT